MLGLDKVAEEIAVTEEKVVNNARAVREEEIQTFRELQGILYFLQAPALFTPKVCRYCKEAFLVSRRYVTCCSWDCLRRELQKQGFEWSKGEGIEFNEDKMLKIINDNSIFQGQEPIWVRNLPQFQAALQKLTEFAESQQTLSVGQEKPISSDYQVVNHYSSSVPSTIGSGLDSSITT